MALQYSWTSLVAQLVKNPPAMQETWVRSLGWEDPLEKEMATHSSNLAWEISWTEELGGLGSTGLQTVRHNTLPASCKTCMQVKTQQLELDIEQQTDSKLGKEHVKAVYCHPAYLTYMQSTS